MTVLSGSKSQDKGTTPVITPDTLLSDDVVEMILGIQEGPIAGLLNGPKNFYLGDTPLVSQSGENNFNPFELHVYHGADDASTVRSVLGGTASNDQVNVQLAEAVPVVRQTPAAARGETDQLEVRIVFNALYRTTTNGDRLEHTAKLNLEYREAGTTPWLPFYNTPLVEITGVTTGGYVKEFVKSVPRIENDYEIRVTKVSPDNETHETVEMTWESFQTINKEDRSYNNLAVVRGLGRASDQFSGIPAMSGVYGCLIVKVPSNYDPINRYYDGAWDGTFKDAHTDNPVWVLYDLIMNERYGLKRYYPFLVTDRFSFYDAARWCDALVPIPDTFPITYQPRWTYNDRIQSPRGALELLHHICGIFGGLLVSDMNGTIRMKLDQPGTPLMVFGPESVTTQGFQYQFSDIAQRINDITVQFTNPHLNWVEDARNITLPDKVAANGRIPDDAMVAIGCNNVHEAQRRAFRRMLQANTEIMTVSFQTTRQAMNLELFDLIGITDPNMGWGLSGRVKNVTGSLIELRDSLTVPAYTTLDLQVQTPSGVHTLEVQSPDPVTHELTILSGTWPADAPDRAHFSVTHSSSLGLVKPFRVLRIEESSENSDLFEITALEHNPNKYGDTDNLESSDTIDFNTQILPIPAAPAILVCASGEGYLQVNPDKTIQDRIFLQWIIDPRSQAQNFELRYRQQDTGIWTEVTVPSKEYYIPNVRRDTYYEIEVRGVNAKGKKGPWSARKTHLVQTDTTAPDIPTGWGAYTGVDTITITGDPSPAIDFKEFRIYGSPDGDDTLTLVGSPTEPRLLINPPVGYNLTRYRISAVDYAGNESDLTAYYTAELDLSSVDLRAKIDEAFDRHDVAVDSAEGAIGELRDRLIGAFGPLDPFDFDGTPTPLIDAVELAYGPLQKFPSPLSPNGEASLADAILKAYGPLDATVSLDDRLKIQAPQISDIQQDTDEIFERLIMTSWEGFGVGQRFVDAGIVVDSTTGQVRISGIDTANEKLSQVDIELDAVRSSIELRATVAYVNKLVSELVLDPTQIPLLDDIEVRLTNVEVDLDAQAGTITQLTDTLTVEGGLVTMTSVTSRLDSVEGEILNKVSSTDFNTEVQRITDAEQAIQAFGDSASIRNSVTATRALSGDLEDITETTLGDLWDRWKQGEDLRASIALAKEDLTAKVNEDMEAEAQQRLELQAVTDASLAQLTETSKVLAGENVALGEQITQIGVSLDTVEGEVDAQGTALDELSVRVEQTEDGIIAEGRDREVLGVAVGELEDYADESGEISVASVWNAFQAGRDLDAAVAIRIQDVQTRVEEDLLAETTERTLLGAALDDTKAIILEERTVRASENAALAEQITTLEAAVTGSDGSIQEAIGKITELEKVDVTSESALVQAHLNLVGVVNDPETGLPQAVGAIDELNNIDVSSDSALVQAHLSLASTVYDPDTGLPAAIGEIEELNNVDVGSNSALVQAHLGLAGAVYDSETGLTALADAYDQITIDLGTINDDYDAVVQRAEILEASVRAGQLLPNGDFFYGDLRGWSWISSQFQVLAQGNAPTQYTLRMAQSGTDERATAITGVVLQEGDQFSASLKARATTGNSGVLKLQLFYYDRTGVYLASDVHTANVSGSAWTDFDFEEVTPPPTASTMRVHLLREAGGSGYLYATKIRVDRIGASLAEAHGAISELNNLSLTSGSVLAQRFTELEGEVLDPETGLVAARGEIQEILDLNISPTSALLTRFTNLEGTINDPTTGLVAAHGEITDILNLNVSPGSVLAQNTIELAGVVNDPATGLAATRGEVQDVLDLNISPTSALLTRFTNLEGTINDPTTGLVAAHGGIQDILDVNVSPSSVLATKFTNLESTVNNPTTGVAANAATISGLITDIENTENDVSAISGKVEVFEASIGGQQVLTNGDFTGGDLRGWAGIQSQFSVIAKGSTGATAVVNAPRPYILQVVADTYSQLSVAADGFVAAPGDRFRSKIWGASWVNGSATATLQIRFYDADDNHISTAGDSYIFSSSTWEEVELKEMVAPANTAYIRIYYGRNGGGSASLYTARILVERTDQATTSVSARVDTIESAYVDADGAIAAVETKISAEYGGLEAMASATAFAKAQADGISAGYLWRLNGSNVMELVSVADGTGGNQVTARIAADYVQITGITQIDTAVIGDLVATNAFLDNLTIGRGQIQDTLESDNYETGVSGILLNFATGAVEVNDLTVRGDMLALGAVDAPQMADGAVTSVQEESGPGSTHTITFEIPPNTVCAAVTYLVIAAVDNVAFTGAGVGRAGISIRRNSTMVKEAFNTKGDTSPAIESVQYSGTLIFSETISTNATAGTVDWSVDADGTVAGDLSIIVMRILK